MQVQVTIINDTGAGESWLDSGFHTLADARKFYSQFTHLVQSIAVEAIQDPSHHNGGIRRASR